MLPFLRDGDLVCVTPAEAAEIRVGDVICYETPPGRLFLHRTNNSLARSLPIYALSDKSLFGMNIDPANPSGDPSSQALKDAGVRWIRIEWKASPGYPFYDPRIMEHRSAGLKVLLLVDYMSVPGKPCRRHRTASGRRTGWRSRTASGRSRPTTATGSTRGRSGTSRTEGP